MRHWECGGDLGSPSGERLGLWGRLGRNDGAAKRFGLKLLSDAKFKILEQTISPCGDPPVYPPDRAIASPLPDMEHRITQAQPEPSAVQMQAFCYPQYGSQMIP